MAEYYLLNTKSYTIVGTAETYESAKVIKDNIDDVIIASEVNEPQ